MTVRIVRVNGKWQLQVRQQCGQLLRVWTANRLVEAFELAGALQLHVDNANELPMSQYALQGAA